jgi:hypothetical protein
MTLAEHHFGSPVLNIGHSYLEARNELRCPIKLELLNNQFRQNVTQADLNFNNLNYENS